MRNEFDHPDSNYWNAYWEKEKRNDTLFYFEGIVESIVSFDGLKSYMEIGGAPGSIMLYMNKKHGMHVSTIDYTDKKRIEAYLKNGGMHEADYDIYEEDFGLTETDAHKGRYDLVASWGFIEHFEKEISQILIGKQMEMVADNGYLILELPNIRKVMWLVYAIFNREMIGIHNLKTMDLQWLKSCVESSEFRLLYCSYYIAMNDQSEFFQKHAMLRKICHGIVEHMRGKKYGEAFKSWVFPYIILILRRKKNND